GSVTDIVAGPDGALYYTDMGSATVRKIVRAGSNQSPIAAASATPTNGPPPLTVQFSSAGSSDPDGDPLSFTWSFGDGSANSTQPTPSHVYSNAGSYTATLTVSDGKASPGPDSTTVPIVVGTPPTVSIQRPVAGCVLYDSSTCPTSSTFRAGDTITL